MEWLDKQKSLKEVFEEIDLKNRIWCLCKKYIQFLKDCDWDELDGFDWSKLLRYQPQFADKCNWEKLNGYNWSWLFLYQPQFEDKCDFNKFNDVDWAELLQRQPQFEKYKI